MQIRQQMLLRRGATNRRDLAQVENRLRQIQQDEDTDDSSPFPVIEKDAKPVSPPVR